jgi:hypothetical protein
VHEGDYEDDHEDGDHQPQAAEPSFRPTRLFGFALAAA